MLKYHIQIAILKIRCELGLIWKVLAKKYHCCEKIISLILGSYNITRKRSKRIY